MILLSNVLVVNKHSGNYTYFQFIVPEVAQKNILAEHLESGRS